MSCMQARLFRVISLLVVLVLSIVFIGAPVSAKPIYTWEDEHGVKHFSSKRNNPQAQVAKLPKINRGEVKLVKTKIVSCTKHGGIDCKAGPDQSDGSVICYDGFKGATARYRFSCSSPKLQISEISDVNVEGRFTVYVRNEKAVAANQPAVFYRPEGEQEVKLAGPAEIEAFGLAEFKFEPKDADIPSGKVDIAQIDITCANCP